MVPVVLNRQQKLKIILEQIGDYLTDDIRKDKIWQDWISGGKYFYHLMETEFINRYESLFISFIPSPEGPEKWTLRVVKRSTVDFQENHEIIFDYDFRNDVDGCVKEFLKLPVWWKLVDAIDNMYQTRLDQNPKYRTIQHEMANRGELQESKKFLDKYYNDPEKKKKHEAWKRWHERDLQRKKELGIVDEPKKKKKKQTHIIEI